MLLLPLGWLAIRLAHRVLAAPQTVLLPVILMCCVVGAYAVMLVFGVLAWFLEDNGVPIAPTIPGLVLGPTVEENFMISMIEAKGHLTAFFGRPIALGLAMTTITIIFAPLLMRVRQGRQHLLRSA